MKRSLVVLFFALACAAVPSKAAAVPITGSIGFGGSIAGGAGSINWATVNSIDIESNQAVVLCFGATPCSGSYAVFNDADLELAVYNDFTFAPGLVVTNPIWSADGFGFNLTSITSVTRGTAGILITGLGTAFGPAGFDPTPATWSFSADETSEIRFSSTTAAVPDGGSMLALLGLGMLGLGVARRRFTNL
jgi:hypothetical protein